MALDHIPDSTVEIYIYRHNDPKYCKEELNFKKKPNVVIMKSNIAECERRTRFLLSFLPRLIAEGQYITTKLQARTYFPDGNVDK